MKYGVKYHPHVLSKDLPKLNQDIKAGIKKAIEERILAAPAEYGLPLRKTLKRYWKLRVGDYRVVYRINEDVIVIFCIRHRKDVYAVAEGGQ